MDKIMQKKILLITKYIILIIKLQNNNNFIFELLYINKRNIIIIDNI